jgi:sulfur-carrier protein
VHRRASASHLIGRNTDVAFVSSAAVHVVLAPALIRLFPDAPTRVDVEADTVATMIAALDTRWPGMGRMLSDERPAVRRHINIFVAGDRATLSTPLAPGAEVYVLTAVSGG